MPTNPRHRPHCRTCGRFTKPSGCPLHTAPATYTPVQAPTTPLLAVGLARMGTHRNAARRQAGHMRLPLWWSAALTYALVLAVAVWVVYRQVG